MFERRLKIFLAALSAVTLVLVVRAAQVQVVERDRWSKAAAESMLRPVYVETTRGNIYDNHGRLLATDQPCVDACVDYHALTSPPDEEWVTKTATARLKSRLGDAYGKMLKKQRKDAIGEECDAVRKEIDAMWAELAHVSGRSAEEIEETRAAIVRRVEMRRRITWYRNFKRAQEEAEEQRQETAERESEWRAWLLEGDKQGPDLDQFSVTVAEQNQSHIILRAVPPDLQNYLGKHVDRFPGLSLRPSTHRYYPYKTAFCHGMGRVGHVNREDLQTDPCAKDDTRQYLPNDLKGRGGVEGLCEQALRGTKGKMNMVAGQEMPTSSTPAEAGKDVHLTIDIELQAELEQTFTHARIVYPTAVEEAVLHGAAIVIDVPTGEVRAIASYPTFDLNAFDEQYDQLCRDQYNQPLFNRATMAQLQPGSTVKPMVGLSAITEGLRGWTRGSNARGTW